MRQNPADVGEAGSLQENTGVVRWPHDEDLEKKEIELDHRSTSDGF